MEKRFVFICPMRTVQVAWLSIQPQGDVSFGLNYKSPGLWENRKVTFHMPIYQHMKSGKGRNQQEDFAGIMDIPIMLEQQGEITWAYATSPPLSALKEPAYARAKAFPVDDVEIRAPHENHSARFDVDLLRKGQLLFDRGNIYHFPSVHALVRVRVSLVDPAPPELGVFHYS